ncbi:hypothetical protein B0H34DRAFT_365120 [Crassisporium funariophilum]|nr:hypothetical protein B0H34DRAFT_365120 [Crassisporium funariophilum]
MIKNLMLIEVRGIGDGQVTRSLDLQSSPMHTLFFAFTSRRSGGTVWPSSMVPFSPFASALVQYLSGEGWRIGVEERKEKGGSRRPEAPTSGCERTRRRQEYDIGPSSVPPVALAGLENLAFLPPAFPSSIKRH